MPDLFAPERSFLPQPHLVEGTPLEAKNSFYEMVRPRVKIVSADEHGSFEKVVTRMPSNGLSAFFLIGTDNVQVGDDFQRFVAVADISVNKDSFIFEEDYDGKAADYTDLIPFIIEHEIYEMWLTAKKGVKPINTDEKHLLARRKEFEMAFEQGKLDRLVEFYKKTRIVDLNEIQYAYDKTIKKMKGKEVT